MTAEKVRLQKQTKELEKERLELKEQVKVLLSSCTSGGAHYPALSHTQIMRLERNAMLANGRMKTVKVANKSALGKKSAQQK